ncbi:hypothetical protein [Sphingomonas sp. PvP018]|uniref:hypothetical protein n=1 Tax=Sphingomonas sp. PvP018 TaxID=2817852 RepID=UPI001AE6FB60|nr:hypothetical protein [Sphingomonas sp. PvP018]
MRYRILDRPQLYLIVSARQHLRIGKKATRVRFIAIRRSAEAKRYGGYYRRRVAVQSIE